VSTATENIASEENIAGSGCDDCPHTIMDDAESLPLIEEIASMFPNEWLAFVVPSTEDQDPIPLHGNLVAHSPGPDDIFDAVNAVLWNQCVYTFFNGSYEAMEASYGDTLEQEDTVQQPTSAAAFKITPSVDPVPDKLFELIYSAIDKLRQKPPNIGEAIRRLRIAKIRAVYNPQSPLLAPLDKALDGLEMSDPAIADIIWQIEESLSELEVALTNDRQMTN
jgi:hypothetical protein